MTRNQIEYWSLQEQKRSNLANEEERHRSNVAHEDETHRANLAGEIEVNRSNLVREKETHRNNTINQMIDQLKLDETKRSNRENEAIKSQANALALSKLIKEITLPFLEMASGSTN